VEVRALTTVRIFSFAGIHALVCWSAGRNAVLQQNVELSSWAKFMQQSLSWKA